MKVLGWVLIAFSLFWIWGVFAPMWADPSQNIPYILGVCAAVPWGIGFWLIFRKKKVKI